MLLNVIWESDCFLLLPFAWLQIFICYITAINKTAFCDGNLEKVVSGTAKVLWIQLNLKELKVLVSSVTSFSYSSPSERADESSASEREGSICWKTDGGESMREVRLTLCVQTPLERAFTWLCTLPAGFLLCVTHTSSSDKHSDV